MRALVQRSLKSSVSIKTDGEYKLKESIEKGFVVLLGVCDTDTDDDLNKLVDKISKLRVFEDENGKMNLSIADCNGEILLISQFTLFASKLKENGITVKTGIFGADMLVNIENHGPVTIMLDSDELLKK